MYAQTFLRLCCHQVDRQGKAIGSGRGVRSWDISPTSQAHHIYTIDWRFGLCRDVELKTPARPPAFAFVTFENFYDAEDAIRGRGKLPLEENCIGMRKPLDHLM